MKKILTLIALLTIALSVCACTGDKKETTANTSALSDGSDLPSITDSDDEGWGELIPLE